MATERLFVVATPGRSVCDDYARALNAEGLLRIIALGTRRGVSGIPRERTRLQPAIGLLSYAGATVLSPYFAESFRANLFPWFDRWVRKQLRPGDHIISSYGYVNECFKWVRAHGGKTFLDAGNSHPDNFWQIISEEHRRWNCPYPPISPQWHRRSMSMLEDVDFVLTPSSYVRESFVSRGFPESKILHTVYPVDFDCFIPATEPRPASRPLTLISTGMLSLRKGTPYLLEAYRIVRREISDARLILVRQIHDSIKPVLEKYSDLPIEWFPSMSHPQLADCLRRADIFILPSLEEGLARTALEALACGIPAIVTAHTGANDFIRSGENGEAVPVRDADAIANAVLKWTNKITASGWRPRRLLTVEQFSFALFERKFIRQLRERGLV